MDANIVDAYLRSGPVIGKPSFEQLFTSHVVENLHINGWNPSFFVMMFLGFNNILMRNPVRDQNSIHKVFFGWYPDLKMIRSIILMHDDDGKKIMKCRSIFVDEIPNDASRQVMEAEISEMALHLAKSVLETQAYGKYITDLASEVIPDGTRFQDYYQPPSPESENLQAMCRSIQNLLIEYTIDSKMYHLKVLKDDVEAETSLSQVSLTEVFNSNDALKGTAFQFKQIPNTNQLVQHAINFERNKLILLDRNVLLLELPENILELYSKINAVESTMEHNAKNLQSVLYGLSELYRMPTESLSLFNTKSELAECAFTMGAFWALTGTSDCPPRVKAVQYTSTDSMDHDEAHHGEAFFLVLEPSFRSNMDNMVDNVPLVITFVADRSLTPEMVNTLKIENKIQSKFLLIEHDYIFGGGGIVTVEIRLKNNFIEKMIKASGLKHAQGQEQRLKTYLEAVFDEIMPIQMRQRLTDVTYLSRYIFGVLLTAERKTNGLVVQEMRPQGAGQFETSYLINWKQKDSHSSFTNKYIILNFNEHINTNEIADPRSETVENFDTIFVHIAQNLATSNSAHQAGKVERSVQVHQALFSSFDEGMSFHQIDRLSIDDFRNGQSDVNTFIANLRSRLRMKKHLIREPILPEYQHLVESSSNFKAIIDGVFHRQPSMKNVIKMPKYLSSIQYTIPIAGVDVTSNTENRPQFLTTLNFKYTADTQYDHANLHEGMAQMITSTIMSSPANQLVNSYFTAGADNQNDDEQSITKDDLLRSCNAMRRRRVVIQACKKLEVEVEKNRKKESDDQKEVIAQKEGLLNEKSLTPILSTDATSKRINILKDIATMCHYVGQSFMLRDLISDVYHRNKLAALKDTGFLVATGFSPRLSSYLIQKGETMVISGLKIRGYATKAFGFGISRAISLYVFYDFIKNTIDYVKDNNNTDAKIGMAVDGAFTAIDLVVLGLEGLEYLGFMGGIAAIANPIGALIGTALIVGLNVYQVVNTVVNIEKIITLNGPELIDESVRAFFHLGIALNVRELINEERANEYLKYQATKFLMLHKDKIDVFITKSGIVGENGIQLRNDAVVDLQDLQYLKVSRASPKSDKKVKVICALHEEAKELQTPTFASKIETFLTKVGHSFKVFYDYMSGARFELLAEDTMAVEQDGKIYSSGYLCRNAFGLQLVNGSQHKTAYFNLGDGNDVVRGFVTKPNSFHLGGGRKRIEGGPLSDIFTLDYENITGILDGSAGLDTIDISSMKTKDFFILSGTDYESKTSLTLKNIENVIGRANIPDVVICGCSFKAVRMLGGSTEKPDLIVAADQKCSYEMTLYLDDFTKVLTDRVRGNFTYLLNMMQHSTIDFTILETENSTAMHTMIMNDSFSALETIKNDPQLDGLFTTKLLLENNRSLAVSISSNKSMFIHFKDGLRIMLTSGKILNVFLLNNKSNEDIYKMYTQKIKQLGISLISSSALDNQTMVISTTINQGHTIIHNTLIGSMNLFIENCGKTLLLVNATYAKSELIFPKISIHISNCSCSALVIDFNLLIERLFSKGTFDNVVSSAKRNDSNLMIVVSRQKTSLKNQVIGHIIIENAFKDKCITNITIRSYNDIRIVDKTISETTDDLAVFKNTDLHAQAEDYIHSLLQPYPLAYALNYEFIHLSNSNTEWFNRIYIAADVGRLEFFNYNATSLIITNLRTLNNTDAANLCSIFVEKFYESKKLWTLKIKSKDWQINLFHLANLDATNDIGNLFKSFEK